VLFIPFQKYGDAHGEMLVSAMGGNAQGMAVLVVQQQERAAPQNDAQTPDQSAREKHVTVDGLTMPIDIAGQRMGLGCVFCESLWGMPELGAPTCKSRREAVCAIGIGHLRQKCLGVPIAVGPLPSGEQGQAVRRVASAASHARGKPTAPKNRSVSRRRRRTAALPARGRQVGSGAGGRASSNCVRSPVSVAAANSSKLPACS
jgi:hypothetical protein